MEKSFEQQEGGSALESDRADEVEVTKITRTSTRRRSIVKGTLCLLIVILTSTALTAESTAAHASLAASSLAVAASAASASGFGSSFCSAGNGEGLSSSGVQLDNVYPCANPNIKDSYGYQCVEYSVRFESVVYGLPSVLGRRARCRCCQ